MGRNYAGILGPLAFGLIVARGVILGGGVEGTLLAASLASLAFATLGYVAGQMADHLIRESVQNQFRSLMADWEKQQAQTQGKAAS